MSEQNATAKDYESGVRGTLVLSDDTGYVGDTITLMGRNLPADRDFDVVWHSVDGSWGVLEANEVIGPQFRSRTESVLTVTTDGDGSFDRQWTLPQDYGGDHRIELRSQENGETVAQAEIEVNPYFEINRTEAPLGEAFTVVGYGLGPSKFRNNYQIAWDNGTVGFMTGVRNRGTATATVRAVGPPGNHRIQVWRNYRGVPFLQNNTQSPFGSVGGERQSAWNVEVTEPETDPQTAWIDPVEDERPLNSHLPGIDDDESGAHLDISPQSGQPGSDAVITGQGFPADTEVDLVWYTHEGHRPKGIEITPEPIPDALPTVTTDADGEFRTAVTVPTDRGATRPITAEIDGTSVAVTGFMMQPKIETFSPTSGPFGTEIEIELSGIGWPMYENAYFMVYDNKPLGYLCGLEAKVNRTVLEATGEPGYHCIDLYPSLFKVQDDEPDFELQPHLSYLDNHPVRPLPAVHFTFEVTE